MEQMTTATPRPSATFTPFGVGRVVAERMRQFARGFAGTAADIDVEAAARAMRTYAEVEADRNRTYAQCSYVF